MGKSAASKRAARRQAEAYERRQEERWNEFLDSMPEERAACWEQAVREVNTMLEGRTAEERLTLLHLTTGHTNQHLRHRDEDFFGRESRPNSIPLMPDRRESVTDALDAHMRAMSLERVNVCLGDPHDARDTSPPYPRDRNGPSR